MMSESTGRYISRAERNMIREVVTGQERLICQLLDEYEEEEPDEEEYEF